MFVRLFSLLVLLLVAFFGQLSVSVANTLSSVAIHEKSKAELLLAKDPDGGMYYALLYITMEPGWYTYWKDPGDTGFAATFDWTGSQNIANTEVLWPVPKRQLDQLLDSVAESYVYKDTVIIPIAIQLMEPDQPITVSLKVDYAVCEELCIPVSAQLYKQESGAFDDDRANALLSEALARVPNFQPVDSMRIVEVIYVVEDAQPYLMVRAFKPEGFDVNTLELFVTGSSNAAFLRPEFDFFEGDLSKLIILSPIEFLGEESRIQSDNKLELILVHGNAAQQVLVSPLGLSPIPINETMAGVGRGVNSDDSTSLWLMLLFAFLGGLILNVMPCVLPVLSIKILGVISHRYGEDKHLIRNFLVTASGIVFSFVLLALVAIVLKNAGHQVGWGFHFQEPLFLVALVIVLTFFAANMWGLYEFTLPAFIGSKLSSVKQTHGATGHFLSGVLATILATPCTAPFLGVAVGFALTQGAVKIVLLFAVMGVGLAFPYLVLSLVPAWVRYLPKPGAWMLRFKQLLGVLLLLTALWLVWVVSGQMGSEAAYVLLIGICMLLVTLARIFWQSQATRLVFLVMVVVLMFVVPGYYERQQEAKDSGSNSAMTWQPFSESRIVRELKLGKTVFVDITADWCLTCKVNKFMVLSSDAVEQALSEPGIVAMRGDWTRKDEAIGAYLAKHGRSGIPFNIVYTPQNPNGVVLSELLSKSEVIEALE